MAVLRQNELRPDESAPPHYGYEYHGLMNHKVSESILGDRPDGSYLIRKSPPSSGGGPSADDEFHTLSVRSNGRTKHFKLYYRPESGHFVHTDFKRFETIHDLVADGLVNFYMQIHAAPIIQAMMAQTRHCYQQSPYMTLNRRKLRALSNDLRKSLKYGDATDAATAATENVAVVTSSSTSAVAAAAVAPNSAGSSQDDLDVLPVVYEKAHHFKVHTFKGLNWCEFCANFLWGFTAQGVKCEDCGFIAHNKCSELVPAKCVPDLKRIRGVFGADLTTLVTAHQCTIPFVVKRCVEEVEARGMLQEGIYRVSGFADEIDTLKLALDRDGEKTNMSEAAYGNVNVIAGTLKLYLRLLPVPLVTYQAYPAFMNSTSNCTNYIYIFFKFDNRIFCRMENR